MLKELSGGSALGVAIPAVPLAFPGLARLLRAAALRIELGVLIQGTAFVFAMLVLEVVSDSGSWGSVPEGMPVFDLALSLCLPSWPEEPLKKDYHP